MSGFMGQDAITGAFLDSAYLPEGRNKDVRPWHDGMLWTRTRSFMSGGAWAGEGNAVWWGPIKEESGNGSRGKISGLTLDKDGNPLGSVTIQGFLTASDAFVFEMISDAGGYYDFCTPYRGQAHYLVMYKAGAPDVTGASVNTLMPI